MKKVQMSYNLLHYFKEKISGRFPNCGSDKLIVAVANYFDPYLNGFFLKELNILETTKQKMSEMWPNDDNDNTIEDARVMVHENISDQPSTLMSHTERLMKRENEEEELKHPHCRVSK